MYRTRPSQATPRAYISAHDYWCEPLDYLSGSLSRYNAFFHETHIDEVWGI